MSTHYRVDGSVAVMTLDNPPVNGMGHATRVAMLAALDQALADPAVRAVVLAGAGKVFSGGADIREFGGAKAYLEPNLRSVIAAFESSSKPLVAALHRVCLGGGLELAMGCHYRIAAPGCLLGLPEVKLGLLPGAGGTQRLPRVLGVESALELITSGEPLVSDQLIKVAGQGLIDRMAWSEDSLLAEATQMALDMADVRPLPKVRDLPCDHPQGEVYFDFVRNTLKAKATHYPAPLQCVAAVEAATRLPFEEGMALERERFVQLMASPESRSLRHLFMAEREAAKIAGVPAGTVLRAVNKVAIVGAGTMGGGIAMNFLNAGIPVKLLDTSDEALERGVSVMRKNYQSQVSRGKLSAEVLLQRMALLSTTLDHQALADADLVIEAVFEDMDVKQQVFGLLDATMKPGAILASNTSTLDLNRMAGFTQRPGDVVGLHFFSPANVMRLLEVVRASHTKADVLATVMALGKRIKKIPVVSGVCDGFIGNRMLEQYVRQAGFLLEEGCTPEQVDRAIEHFGFAMGPFRMGDLAGNDIGWAIRKRRYVEKPDIRYSRIADLLCEKGRFGQKTGAGWYDYQPGQREPIPNADVLQMIEDHRRKQGVKPRHISDDEIVQRLVFALVNEGARILEEGIASRASDIDVVYVMGYGFAAWRGGPMHYANVFGLDKVVQAMAGFAKNPLDDAVFWQAAPLLARLSAQGKPFA